MIPSPSLSRHAQIAAVACVIGGLAIALVTAITVATRPGVELFAPLGFGSLGHVSPWQSAVARGVLMVPALVGGTAFLVLARAFLRVGQGHGFEPRMATLLGRFAALLAVGTALGVAAAPAASVILSLGAPPDGGRLSLQLSSTHLVGLIASLAVWAFARLMGRAARIQAENLEFV